MNANKLYEILEKEFIKPELSDEWLNSMGEVKDYLSDNFEEREMGVVCDFSKEINKVYTAVFPTEKVMQYILDQGIEDALLFTHHPANWDITKAPDIFQNMSKDLLNEFKKRRISIYNLHVPLDAYSEYSTSKTLADALGITIEKPFALYFGGLCGIIGKTDCKTIEELKEKYSKTVGHKVSFYNYGPSEIKDQRVAIAAGGGNDLDVLSEIPKGINTFLTGITIKNDFSKPVHDFEEKNKINVLGGTHYSTEKFACIAMVEFFKKLNLPCEFIEGKPDFEDL